MKRMNPIAAKNDLMRKIFMGCRVIITPGVGAMLPPLQSKLMEAVQNFSHFTEDNDPHGEHDFGHTFVEGEQYFWKFDYYDDLYLYFKKDGNRVLTIMRADEY